MWYIMPLHAIAHLEPTLTTGTANNAYPPGNVRTLDPAFQARITESTGDIKLDWTLDSTALNQDFDIDSVLILNSTVRASTTVKIIEDPTGTPTTLYSAAPTISVWSSFGALGHVNVQYFWDRTTGTSENKLGLVSLGPSFVVAEKGPQIQTELLTAERIGQGFRRPVEGIVRRTFSFRAVPRARAHLIMDLASCNYCFDKDGNVKIVGIGGGGGQNPIAIIDNTIGAQVIYYGTARVSAKTWAANYVELIVIMDVLPINDWV